MQAKRLATSPVLALLLALAVFAFAGCGGGDSSSSTATETVTEEEAAGSGEQPSGNASAPSGDAVRSEKVVISDFAYDPDPVTIEEGGKVIWQNEDSVAHTATAEDGSFDTGTIEEGKIASETFKQPGTYAYVCSIHPQMHGTIEVVPAG
jgi:plastocyanin